MPAIRILFVGNSYTFCNDLPGTLASLLGTRETEPRYETYLRGGASFKTHWLDNLGQDTGRDRHALDLDARRKGGLDRALAKGPWDWLILQGQSLEAIEHPEAFGRYGRLLVEAARESRVGNVLFFQTWAREHRPETQGDISGAYRKLAEELGVRVAPVGDAWRAALRSDDCPTLHVADRSHPTPAGTYLAACVFYAATTGRSPVGLPGRLPEPRDEDGSPIHDHDEARTAFLQRVAATACQLD